MYKRQKEKEMGVLSLQGKKNREGSSVTNVYCYGGPYTKIFPIRPFIWPSEETLSEDSPYLLNTIILLSSGQDGRSASPQPEQCRQRLQMVGCEPPVQGSNHAWSDNA